MRINLDTTDANAIANPIVRKFSEKSCSLLGGECILGMLHFLHPFPIVSDDLGATSRISRHQTVTFRCIKDLD